MAMSDDKYLDYRAKDFFEYEVKKKYYQKIMSIFKYETEVLVISPSGEIEELLVDVKGVEKSDNVGKYHFETLYNRFSSLPLADAYNEYITACAACREGYIVFIIDPMSLSVFFPGVLHELQKEALQSILEALDPNFGVYAGIVSLQGILCVDELNGGEEVPIHFVKQEMENIPVVHYDYTPSFKSV